MEKFGSGTWDKHPGFATLVGSAPEVVNIVGDLDPQNSHVFGPSRSGSISQSYGSHRGKESEPLVRGNGSGSRISINGGNGGNFRYFGAYLPIFL